MGGSLFEMGRLAQCFSKSAVHLKHLRGFKNTNTCTLPQGFQSGVQPGQWNLETPRVLMRGQG